MLPTQKTPPKTSLSDLTVLVYGPSKIGKSTWCSKADGALFLATEAGLNNLDVFQVPIGTWEDLLQACKEIAEGKHPYKTIIIDTVDNAYRMCAEHVCAKFKIEHESDLGYGKGYALINNEFYRVLNKLALLPYGLFLISHSQEKELETRTGKLTRMVPTLPDKARKIVLGMVDVMATRENIKWLKNDLHVCGLDLQKLSDLPANLERLLDVKLEVTKRTKGESENVYFNHRIVLDEGAGGGDAHGGSSADDIPF
jgi:hypothetical protein